jgi:two-component system OmpR family response regulator
MRKILYLDDEADIREVARMALELDSDLQVTGLGDPRRLVSVAKEERPDLILLDFRMPGMDGLQVLEALQTSPEVANTPVVFLTASVQKHELRKLTEAGAMGVIEKPFDPLTIAERVKAYLPGN